MPSTFNTFSGTVPVNYDRYMGPLFFEPYAEDLAARLDAGKVNKALEIACGTGRVTRHLRKVLPASALLVATDLNSGMLQVAKEFPTGGALQFCEADAQQLPFDDDNFDAVVCQFGYMFVPDKAMAFNEAFRVLKAGGQFLFNTWDAIENNPLHNTVSNIIAGYFPGTAAANFYNIPFSMYDTNAIKQGLVEAGFTNITIGLVTKTGVAYNASDAVKALILGTPVFNLINELDSSAPTKLVEISTKKVTELYGDHPCESELNAWVVQAFK